jgi:DNA-binding protein HU-beta
MWLYQAYMAGLFCQMLPILVNQIDLLQLLDKSSFIFYYHDMNTINKETFVRYLAKKNRRTQHHYNEAIVEILEGIKDQLKEGKHVHFLGFGTFYTRVKKSSKAFNIKTKQTMDVPEMRLAAFRVGNVLRRAVKTKKLPEKHGLMSKITSFGKKKQ